eukprot:1175773-Prorocentrum_minimum.AAC.1
MRGEQWIRYTIIPQHSATKAYRRCGVSSVLHTQSFHNIPRNESLPAMRGEQWITQRGQASNPGQSATPRALISGDSTP